MSFWRKEVIDFALDNETRTHIEEQLAWVAREPENESPVWAATTAVREPLERVNRVWRGMVMDSYALEKLTGWTPDLTPPPDTPLFRWRVLAGSAPNSLFAVALAQQVLGEVGERGAGQGGERQWSRDVDRGEAEAGG